MQQHLGAAGGMPPGCQHRLASLPRTQPFGNAIDEQVGDVVFGEIPARKLLVVRPQARADLRDRGARQQQSPALVAERVLDVAHRKATGEELDGQVLQGLRLPLQVFADRRVVRLRLAGDLGRRIVHRSLGGLQPARPIAIAIARARLRAVLVVVPADRVPRLRLQRLLDDQPRRQLHQLLASCRRRQAALDHVRKRLARAHRCR